MKSLVCGVGIMLLGISCQAPSHSNDHPATTENIIMSTRATFIHTVFFYLKDDVTDEQKSTFEEGMRKLGTCPTIDHFRIGQPAMTPRDIVDNSYDYAWIVEFKNSTDQDAYQAEPIHLEFIARYENLWKEVKVYDSVMMDN